jgi:hypothetical protein
MTRDNRSGSTNGTTGGRQPGLDPDQQLERLFEQISIEKAPASLRRRLQRIPREQQPRERWWQRLLAAPPGPRWVLVPALAVAVLVLGVVLVTPRQPSQEEVLQARHDLAVAFGYIEDAGVLTGREIEFALDEGLRNPVKDNLAEHIPFTKQFRKEESS